MLTTVHKAAAIAVAAGLAAVAAATPASADTSWTLSFPAGQVCDFSLTIWGAGTQNGSR